MKLCSSCILLSAFACFSAVTPAFAATVVVDNDFIDCPQADFSSIQAAVLAAQPGDKILVCPGTYAESVLVSKDNLRIEAHAAPGEVVLRGTGPTDQRIGFHLLNTTGVLVQGFTVQQYRIGIVIQEGSANRIRKNVTAENQIVGIEVFNSTANVVEHNVSFLNAGIRFPGGVFVAGPQSTDNIVRHNEAFQNDSGIGAITAGRGNVFLGNRSYANANAGILNAVGSNGSVYENNHVFENAQVGILIGASTDVTVRNNRSERNTGSGVRLQNGSANSLVEKNEIFKNILDGIQLQNNVDANIIQLNHIRESGRDGIRVDTTSDGNKIDRNVVRENLEHDAHDDSVGAGTGGTANLWINNKCETDNRGGLLCENQF
jgi:parallel beta-helix repeat protein